MLEKAETTEIDKAAVVACPALNFSARRAFLACPSCKYFDGLVMLGEAGKWSDRYAIRCAHVIERRTQHFEVIEG